LPARNSFEVIIQHFDDPESQNVWEHIDRFIDDEMLVVDPAEADRIYLNLKERAIRVAKSNVKQN